jgi:hypothetical protein
MATGPLGLVAIGVSDVSYVSADGEWGRGPIPEDMYASGGARQLPGIAVGEDAVVVVMWSRESVPSVWLGTLE